ncbi:MAG: phosphate signaling complex protein PhoU [Anaerolineae bacterium]|nr:MAG: phosphate signaling complex protein PhoU [Anaerolineae bacterium]
MPRETFDGQLAHTLDALLLMGNMVEEAIEKAVQALIKQDVALAQRVIDEDEGVNQALRNIQENCEVLIATQQPMATDLRFLLATHNIANELERIGDYAEGIARLAIRLADEPQLKPYLDVPRMTQKGCELLRGQLQAFVNRDVDAARTLARGDDEIDALYNQVYRELLLFMIEDPRTISQATHLLWVAHNLERIGDRTTNLGEQVVYMVSGKVVELN